MCACCWAAGKLCYYHAKRAAGLLDTAPGTGRGKKANPNAARKHDAERDRATRIAADKEIVEMLRGEL